MSARQENSDSVDNGEPKHQVCLAFVLSLSYLPQRKLKDDKEKLAKNLIDDLSRCLFLSCLYNASSDQCEYVKTLCAVHLS